MWFVVTGLKCENLLIFNAFELQNVSGVSIAYINTPGCVHFWHSELSRGHELILCLGKRLEASPPKANDLDLSLHFFPFHSFAFTLYLCLIWFPLWLSLYLFQSLFPSLVMLKIWCAGRKGTCARLTWDDTSRFITMGSPRDQKTHLKGVFQGINCLTWLTQVWETFHTAIKGLVERKNCAVVSQEEGWNICIKRWGISHKITWSEQTKLRWLN